MAFVDDSDLIKRFRNGDLSGFEGLVRKYQDRVYNLCRYMVLGRGEAAGSYCKGARQQPQDPFRR